MFLLISRHFVELIHTLSNGKGLKADLCCLLGLSEMWEKVQTKWDMIESSSVSLNICSCWGKDSGLVTWISLLQQDLSFFKKMSCHILSEIVKNTVACVHVIFSKLARPKVALKERIKVSVLWHWSENWKLSSEEQINTSLSYSRAAIMET